MIALALDSLYLRFGLQPIELLIEPVLLQLPLDVMPLLLVLGLCGDLTLNLIKLLLLLAVFLLPLQPLDLFLTPQLIETLLLAALRLFLLNVINGILRR